jgi:AcrR family transcriptional regulator
VRDTRERVMAVALEEFSARGYHATSIEDIAAKAGVTKGAVYYYFRDKDDLAIDLQEDLWRRLGLQGAGAFDAGASTVDNLKACFRAYLSALQDLGEARFFLRDCWAVPALDVGGRRTQEAGAALLVDLLEGGIRAGELRPLDTQAAAAVLVGAYSEATLHILTTGTTEATTEVVDHLIDALGLGPRAGKEQEETKAERGGRPGAPTLRKTRADGGRPGTGAGRGPRAGKETAPGRGPGSPTLRRSPGRGPRASKKTP